MKKFLLGLAVGVATVYAASKLIDDETKEEFYDKLNRAKDDAEYKFKRGKRKAMRASIKAKHEVKAGREKMTQYAGDLVGKVSDDLHTLEEKLREKSGK